MSLTSYPTRRGDRTLVLAWLLALLSCAEGPPAGEAATEPDPMPVVSRAPVVSFLRGPAHPRPGEVFELTAGIERRRALAQPVHVTLSLPPGVRLLEGSTDHILPPNTRPHRETLYFHVRADPMPNEDARLTVSLQGAFSGYHAQHLYRFGRLAALPEPPRRGGPELQIGRHRLGRAIELSPPTAPP